MQRWFFYRGSMGAEASNQNDRRQSEGPRFQGNRIKENEVILNGALAWAKAAGNVG